MDRDEALKLVELIGLEKEINEKLVVETRGHIFNEHDTELNFINMNAMPDGDIAILRANPTGQFVKIPNVVGLNHCGGCGERLSLETNGQTIRPSTECTFDRKIPWTFEVDFPTGEVLIGNDFRQFVQVPPVKDWYVNELKEIKRCSEDYAKHSGMLHFFVGNTCPPVYQEGDSRLVVGSNKNATEIVKYDGEEFEDITNEIIEELPGKYLNSVTTDLWWVGMVDKANIIPTKDVPLHYGFNTRVKPGRYRCTYYFYTFEGDTGYENECQIWADVVRVGDCDNEGSVQN